MRLTKTPFSEQLPAAQLHWIIADKDDCIVVESMKDGLHVYDNPVGVLTNNPPFPMQMFELNNYAGVSRKQPESTFAEVLKLNAYSRGMGGMEYQVIFQASHDRCRFLGRTHPYRLHTAPDTGTCRSGEQQYISIGAWRRR